MPYIKDGDRQSAWAAMYDDEYIHNVGELNFLITTLCCMYLDCQGTVKYKDYNAVIGVLECAKQEFYRRAVAPYENEKIEDNGDVYDTN